MNYQEKFNFDKLISDIKNYKKEIESLNKQVKTLNKNSKINEETIEDLEKISYKKPYE